MQGAGREPISYGGVSEWVRWGPEHDGSGDGDQILASAATAGLVDRVDLVDLGTHRLRDLSGTERLFQVRADGLLRVFPTLRTLDAVPKLPVHTTSFVGR